MAHPLLKLTPYLDLSRILFFDHAHDKQYILNELVNSAATNPNITDADAFRSAIFEREEVSSTGIGNGIAVPHAKIPSNTGLSITIGVSSHGIEYHAHDQQPVSILFMISANDKERKEYLRLLASVAGTLKDERIFQALKDARTSQDIMSILA